MIKGYDFAGVTDLYNENQRINEQNKVSALVTIVVYWIIPDTYSF